MDKAYHRIYTHMYKKLRVKYPDIITTDITS